jgi:nicotine blue oxidoreductase
MQAAAVILAAGSSTRFGSPKQVARIGELTLLERVVALAREAGLAPIVAVVPPGLAVPADVLAVRNDAAHEGMSRSLRLGFAALPPDVRAAVILLGDQPTVPMESVTRVVAAAAGGSPVVAASAGGRLAPPILLMRAAFDLVDQTSGDAGLAPVLARHPELVTQVDVGEHPPDVDVPADLAALGELDGDVVAGSPETGAGRP